MRVRPPAQPAFGVRAHKAEALLEGLREEVRPLRRPDPREATEADAAPHDALVDRAVDARRPRSLRRDVEKVQTVEAARALRF